MKMLLASTANIMNYAPYSRNCNISNVGRRYLAPVPGIADVQLFVNFGSTQPTSFEFSVMDLCHPSQSAPATTDCYVIGWNGAYWYGVFKNFVTTGLYSSFLFALTTGSKIYFSEQYQVETDCDTLTKVSVCYPSNYNAEDVNGIYIGLADLTKPHSGNSTIFYHHNFWTRQGEIIEKSNKITFTSNPRKNFATNLVKNFEFRPELVPGWYKDYLLSVYFRGDILINGVHALVTDLAFEDVDVDYWKAYAVLGKEVKGAFGCSPFDCPDGDCAPEICVPVMFTPPTFLDAVVGVLYTKTVVFAGTAPFTLYGEGGLPAWMGHSITGNVLTLSGTPVSNGTVGIGFSIMNNCGDQTFAGGTIEVLIDPPITAVGGTISFNARNVTVDIDQPVPFDAPFGILGTYDRDGIPTEFFVNVIIPDGSLTKTQTAAEVEHYVISCIKPTVSGGTTFTTSHVWGGSNYLFTLNINSVC
jgi:hypothetical protein